MTKDEQNEYYENKVAQFEKENNKLEIGDYCQGGDGDIDCQSWCDYPSEEEIQDDSVIAWKEIVLPELKESK